MTQPKRLSCCWIVGQFNFSLYGDTKMQKQDSHIHDGSKTALGHVEALRAIVGERNARCEKHDLAPFLKDWSGDYVASPLCVVFPSTTDDVSYVMRYCAANGLSVVPQGGNTGLVGGCFVENNSTAVVLNLSRMNKIGEVNSLDYAVEVEAGAIIQDIQAHAERADRLFPLSFGAQGSAQIGGALATNAGGLNVLRFGMTRELVLGVEVVLPDGTILSRLSKLRKDNSGFDIKQLFIGSEGTLGVVTKVSLKLYPRPARRETVLLALGQETDVLPLYAQARTHCADLLSAFELIPRRCIELALEHQSGLRDPLHDAYETYVLMELAASGPLELKPLLESLLENMMAEGIVLDGAVAQSQAQSEAFWAIREAMVEAQAARGLHLRTDISVPVSQIPHFIKAARDAVSNNAPDWEVIAYGHIGDGNVHFNVLPPLNTDPKHVRDQIPDLTKTIYEVLGKFEGSISAEHGIGRVRKAANLSRKPASEMGISRGIKSLFDPLNIMNPGCLFDAESEAQDV